MMKRRSYDTSLKHLVRLGLTDAIPLDLYTKIPSSNLSRWRNEDSQKYIGREINEKVQQNYKLLVNVAKSNKAQRLVECYFQLAQVLNQVILVSVSCKKLLYQSKEKIVDVIQQVKDILGLEKATSFWSISVSTYYNWLLVSKVKCIHNYFEICNRIRSNQLTKQEVMTMKQLFDSSEFQYWGISAIAHYARRNGIVIAGVSTFYKYARLLGIKRRTFKKLKYRTGIRSGGPNLLWHIDITQFKYNNQKQMIYFVVDNYSRMVLNWCIHKRVCGKTMTNLLKETIKQFRPEGSLLLADGGPENNNQHIDCLLQQEGIMKFIAQRDVTFSNSIVEALIKIIKNNYLHQMVITSISELTTALDFSVNDYNNKRPHHTLKGLTPKEVFSGKTIDKCLQHAQTKAAQAKRLEENRKNRCNDCLMK